jgi:hypothetical protein
MELGKEGEMQVADLILGDRRMGVDRIKPGVLDSLLGFKTGSVESRSVFNVFQG